MKIIKTLVTPCLVLFLSLFSLHAEHINSLAPMSGFGPSGSGEILADGSVPFLSAGAIQRGMAHNPVTGNLIFIDRGVSGQTSDVAGGIYVLNGTNGSIVRTLTTDGIEGGSFAHYAVGVADDGVIYIANVIVNSNAAPFKVYRWESEITANAPTVAFSDALGTNNLRWGNTIDVRGSGASTEILVSAGGAESAVLTTTDGLNFAANVLSTDAVVSLQGSLAFASGNTYWAKFANHPLRLMSFDLEQKTATTIISFGASEMPEIVPHEMVAVDSDNQLLASVHHHGTDPDEIFLYDIANTDSNSSPVFLDSFVIESISVGNSGSPRGYISFGDDQVYVHNLNNGIFAFNLIGGPIPAPVILTEPANQAGLAGNTVRFRVLAQRGFTFQWRKGTTSISGATNSVLTLTNIQASDMGNYSVVVSNSTASVTSIDASLTVLALEDFYRLVPIWSAAPNAQPYSMLAGGSQNSPNQRSLAYNSFSNHLYVVARTGGTAEYNVHVIDGDTGVPLYTLNTNGSNFTGFAGQIGLVSIAVGDDGSVYACNVDTSGSWKVYRWADGNSNTVPVLVFDGDPFGSPTTTRWGDVMDVRGGGINTQIIIDAQQLASPFFAILQPSDASLTSFTPIVFSGTPNTGSIARDIQFGSGDTFWQRRLNSPLIHSSFSLEEPFSAAPLISTHTNFPNSIAHIALDESRNLLGAIDHTGVAGASPDQVALYDVTDLDAPVRLSRFDFPENKRANNPGIGKVIFGGDKLFALEAQNGLAAFRLEIGALPPTLNVASLDAEIILTWEGSDFVLESKTDLSSATWANVPYQSGSPNTATIEISGDAKFFRLRK